MNLLNSSEISSDSCQIKDEKRVGLLRLYSAVQRQTAVTAHFSSKQLLPLAFAEQYLSTQYEAILDSSPRGERQPDISEDQEEASSYPAQLTGNNITYSPRLI